MRLLVLHLNQYDFIDEKTKRNIVGRNATFIDPDTPQNPDSNQIGFAPMKMTIPPALYQSFTHAPAFYEVEYATQRGSDGKPQLVLTAARLASKVNFSSMQSQKVA